MQRTPWAFFFAGVLLLVGGSEALGVRGDEEPKCDIVSFNVRTALGEPVRVEEQEGGGYKVTICSDATGFRASAEPTEALFDADYTCAVRGVPAGVTDLEQGAETEFEVTIWTVPKGKSVDSLVNAKAVCEGGECKKLEAEGVDEMRRTVKVTATRLGEDATPDQCAPTGRNAKDDCGYSVSLEHQRQQAALNPGSGIAPPAPPTFLQAGRKPGKLRHAGC